MNDYNKFLQGKAVLAQQSGFECDESEINPILFPHQRAIVQWAVRGGRRAIFARFGLGKTLMQLEAVRLVLEKSGGNKGLIVCPLGVRHEFVRDAELLGLHVVFVRTNEKMDQLSFDGQPQIFITNYESVRSGKLDPRQSDALSLDEASVLRGFGGTVTFRELMRMYEGTSKYRFVATALPSPNEFIELLAYAAYLDILDVGHAKTLFFKRDSTKADKLTLLPHREKAFWMFCASWACFLNRPSDLGFSDEGYELPPLEVRWHEISTDHANATAERDGQNRLFHDASLGVTAAAREKRSSLDARVEKLLELRKERPGEHCVIWHDLEDERRAIEKAIPEAATVYGLQNLEDREQIVIDFSDGRISELAAKPSMLGAGTNLQRHCSWEIFLGIGFKFYEFYQALHRCYRFLQTKPVRIDLIYTEAERNVRRELERKWREHGKLVDEMSRLIREYGLANEAISGALKRTIGVERIEQTGRDWRLVRNDAILEAETIESGSVHLILTSVPFSTQYEYSPSMNDFGHNVDNAAFFAQMDFLTPHLYRVLQPGRMCAIHVKDRIVPGGITNLGFQTVYPFHVDCITHYQKHGFAFMGMKTIVTDVVRENNQTYRLGWTEHCKDGTKMGCGMPEYLLIFRKPPTDNSDGYADVPVVKDKPLCDDHGEPAPFDPRKNWKQPIPETGYSRARWQLDAHGFTRSSGNRLLSVLSSKEIDTLPHEKLYKLWRERSTHSVYDFNGHARVTEELDHAQRLPSGFMLLPPHSWHPDVWTDVARMRTLNMMQERKRKEMHLCPMPFDIVDRTIVQFSMEGETILDPFAGIGTVPYCAVKLRRKAIGIELSESYFFDAVHYATQAESEAAVMTLFDFMEASA